MVRDSFDNSLNELHDELMNMSNIVENQIYLSIEALINHNEKLADKIINDDDIVDTFNKKIEDRCIRLIAMQQPLATDLRNIFTVSKIVTDLERIGDHAVDIAKVTIRLKDEIYIKELIDIPKMATLVKDMIKEALDAYVAGDIEKAYEICKKDDLVDELYNQVFIELLELMSKDSTVTNQATQFLFVCKFLERIADHVTNICEWIIYLVTGKQVDLNE